MGTISIYKDSNFNFALNTTDKSDAELNVKEQERSVITPKSDDRKISTENGKAQVYISEDTITMSNESNCVVVNDKGLIISGRTHVTKTPSSIRVAGFWVLNDELLTTLPSTTYTPIPVLLYKEIPYAKTASAIAKILKG